MVKQNMPFLIAVFLLVLYSGFLFGQIGSPAALRKTAEEYYRWRNENYPVNSSDQGLHTWDNRLTDYSQPALVSRQQYVRNLLAAVQAMQTTSWQREDRIDWLLFRSQLEQVAFFDRVIRFPETNPQIYIHECSNGIFSLLKKEYDLPRNRALSATARLRQMPGLLQQAKANLKAPVRLYAQLAIDSAHGRASTSN